MTTSPTVAIIDDDADVRTAVGRLLKSAGLAPVSFGSAQKFLEAEGYRGAAAVVLDVRMPDMDGLTLQARLGEAGSKVPIIFMTAIEDGTSEGKALTAGAKAFLYKPIDETELLDAVHHAIDAR